MKCLVLFFLSFNLLAGDAPPPDARELAEMDCFSNSQGLRKIIIGLKSGVLPEVMKLRMQLNTENSIKKLTSIAAIERLNYVFKTAIVMVDVSKNFAATTNPDDAQMIYYDACVKSVNDYYNNKEKKQ